MNSYTVVQHFGLSSILAGTCTWREVALFSKGYDLMKEGRPRLTVAARRLDSEGPLVWNGLAGSGFIEGKGLAGMFMVTGIDIPSSGCREIGAHYVDVSGKRSRRRHGEVALP